MLANAVNADTLKEALEKEGKFVITYRVLDDEATHYYQVKFIKLDEYAGIKDTVLASFQNMDVVVEKEHADAQDWMIPKARWRLRLPPPIKPIKLKPISFLTCPMTSEHQ